MYFCIKISFRGHLKHSCSPCSTFAYQKGCAFPLPIGETLLCCVHLQRYWWRHCCLRLKPAENKSRASTSRPWMLFQHHWLRHYPPPSCHRLRKQRICRRSLFDSLTMMVLQRYLKCVFDVSRFSRYLCYDVKQGCARGTKVGRKLKLRGQRKGPDFKMGVANLQWVASEWLTPQCLTWNMRKCGPCTNQVMCIWRGGAAWLHTTDAKYQTNRSWNQGQKQKQMDSEIQNECFQRKLFSLTVRNRHVQVNAAKEARPH